MKIKFVSPNGHVIFLISLLVMLLIKLAFIAHNLHNGWVPLWGFFQWGLVQTSNFSCAEYNTNELEQRILLIRVRFGMWKVRRLSYCRSDSTNRKDFFSEILFIVTFALLSESWYLNGYRASVSVVIANLVVEDKQKKTLESS